MDELPLLPFEEVLSYLSLEDRLTARAVSQGWRERFDSEMEILCYSSHPISFIFEKNRWVNGAFAQNFIKSTRFDLFFNAFSRSILSDLKHLRLCDLELNERDRTAFTESLNSFDQLEELEIVRCRCRGASGRVPLAEFELTLPMLRRIYFEAFAGVSRLTLDAARLQQVRIDVHLNRLELVHVESVERVIIDKFAQMEVKQLKNLKQLYVKSPYGSTIDPTLLSDLEHLEEVHLNYADHFSEIVEQRQRYGRTNLKIYLFGLIQNRPDDEEPNAGFEIFVDALFIHLAENLSRLVDEVPFYPSLRYSSIERVAPELAINVLNRFIDLRTVYVDEPVRDTQRFLDTLKNLDNIVELRFWGDYPRDLFDRLPEHCALQRLTLYNLPANPEFLFRLKHLSYLNTSSIGLTTIRRILEKLQFISSFGFRFQDITFTIQGKQSHGKQFHVAALGNKPTIVPDVDAAIQYITEHGKRNYY